MNIHRYSLVDLTFSKSSFGKKKKKRHALGRDAREGEDARGQKRRATMRKDPTVPVHSPPLGSETPRLLAHATQRQRARRVAVRLTSRGGAFPTGAASDPLLPGVSTAN